MSLNFVCIIGSVRENRQADNVVKYFKQKFAEHMAPKGHTCQIVDPAILDLPLLKCPLHWYSDPAEIPDELKDLNQSIVDADGYFFLTAEYNRCVPPALLNTLDHLPTKSFSYKTSGIISYSQGEGGGMMANSALLPVLWEFGCLPISHSVNIRTVHKEISAEGTTENAHVDNSMVKLFDQMEWWATCAKKGRANGIPMEKGRANGIPM